MVITVININVIIVISLLILLIGSEQREGQIL